MRKKRLPIDQLREAGRIAKEMLIKKGIIAKHSVLDEIMKTKGAPTLPGIPVYLPHRWTIKAAQRMMYDLLVIWKAECKADPEVADNLTAFFKFLMIELRKQEKEYQREVVRMSKIIKTQDVPVLREVFSPARKKETVQTIHRFFIDSLVVAIALKNNHTTSEYANWFLSWTEELHALWIKPLDRRGAKKNAKN